MVIAEWTRIALRAVADVHRLLEYRQMLHLHPIVVTVKEPVLPPAFLAPTTLERAFHTDCPAAIFSCFDAQYPHVRQIQGNLDMAHRSPPVLTLRHYPSYPHIYALPLSFPKTRHSTLVVGAH